MILVDDPDDPRVAPFRLNERGLANRVQRRDDGGDGWFMAEGDLVVERALAAGCVPAMALVDGERPPPVTATLAERCPVYAGGDRMRAAVTKLGMPYSVVALFERPARAAVDQLATTARRLVIAEAIDNPVNVGSIVRNALALGWDGLITDATSCDPLARRALRVSMGHALHLPHARCDDLSALVQRLARDGVVVCALTPAPDAIALDDVPVAPRVALLVGSERAGLSPAVMAAATHRVAIPMLNGVDSLNAAAATAIACWQLRAR
ncbi:MAG: RNA methyltransferase [Actinomycetota bacterium]|nr:RNA methyltransferase [Actinomycetota bacterium]